MGDSRRGSHFATVGRSRKRADELETHWKSRADIAQFFASVWPRLQLISCWADASAAQYVQQVQNLFSDTEIQPKGLLSTEACISVPLCDQPGSLLAIRSHFLEFKECSSSDRSDEEAIKLAHELESGGRYQVIVTTGGGLYRYQTGDMIEVVGHQEQCPIIRFIGRADKVTDLVGEKLSEPHVREVLLRSLNRLDVQTQFALLVPRNGLKPQYELLVQPSAGQVTDAVVGQLRDQVETGLKENPYYRHAVDMNQLAPLTIRRLDAKAPNYWRHYERACVAQGQKLGDIKPTVLAAADLLCDDELVV